MILINPDNPLARHFGSLNGVFLADGSLGVSAALKRGCAWFNPNDSGLTMSAHAATSSHQAPLPRPGTPCSAAARAVSHHPAKPLGMRGMTLLELLATMAILAILAAAALPYAEMTIVRGKELELRRSLREIRTAIDRFHEDWVSGKVSRLSVAASDDGYPKTLQGLVDGVELAQAKGGKVKYLRRIPEDPFATGNNRAGQWILRGYQDDRNSLSWGGKDVYDVRSSSGATAIDGSRYRDW